MVLLREAARDAARSVAERGRGAVAAEAFYIETGRTVSVTVGVGVSEFGRDGDTPDTLLRVADERLSGPSTMAATAWRPDRNV
jgi:two-component system, cell cycle response regulator